MESFMMALYGLKSKIKVLIYIWKLLNHQYQEALTFAIDKIEKDIELGNRTPHLKRAECVEWSNHYARERRNFPQIKDIDKSILLELMVMKHKKKGPYA